LCVFLLGKYTKQRIIQIIIISNEREREIGFQIIINK